MLRVKYTTDKGETHTQVAVDAFTADNGAKSGIYIQFYNESDRLLFVETKYADKLLDRLLAEGWVNLMPYNNAYFIMK